MHEGQVFVLLGHNGAGKSTTIGMLSGMLQPDSGKAEIYGYDIYSQMNIIRKMMGVCPQHDVLFPELTVHEHLEFYSGLKGISKKESLKGIKQIIADVGLTEKVNSRADSLSGGQRRKLSVAIALTGNSKVIFLDEPTSGMDPYSRRSTWNLIQNNTEGRIIILTTHFMDEADLLSDRIGIMANGKIFCSGTSHFLKQAFGEGYCLTIVKNDNCNVDELSNIIMDYIPSAISLSDVGKEVSFQLPYSSTSVFGELFGRFDENKQSLGIDSYGVSVTTLEEVFIKAAELTDVTEIKEESSSDKSYYSDVKSDKSDQENKEKESPSKKVIEMSDINTEIINSNEDLSDSDKSKDKEKDKDKETIVVKDDEINSGNNERKPRSSATLEADDPKKLFLQAVERRHTSSRRSSIFIKTDSSKDYFLKNEKLKKNLFCTHFSALIVKRWRYTKRDIKALLFQIIIPILLLLICCQILAFIPLGDAPSMKLDTSYYNQYVSVRNNRGKTPFPYDTSFEETKSIIDNLDTDV